MKPSFRMLVLRTLRRLLQEVAEESDSELLHQLQDAIEQEKSEQAEGGVHDPG